MTTFSDVWEKLGASKQYRAAFATAQFKRLVPFQIRALRKNRGMSQEELAEKANLTQGVISRAEDPDYGNLASNTILKIADGFDCAFLGRFVPFSELDEWFLDVSEDAIQVPTFDQEDELFRSGRLRPKRKVSRPKIRRKTNIIRIDTRRPVTVPCNPSAGAMQLSLNWNDGWGSEAGPQVGNSTPSQANAAVLERSLMWAVGAGGNYGNR